MLEGSYTAIVTPFHADGSVDFEKYEQLIQRQIDRGIDGIVPAGTTGESPTLDVDEHIRVIETAVRACKGKARVIAGTGANSTREAIALTQRAKDAGADATLQVTPYYNKPSQAGLVAHFSAVADVGLPVVLYNVPGRTSREIAVETVVELSAHPNVVAVKEAGGRVDRVSHILRECDIEVLSGDDMLTFPMMAVGAIGVISVASNLIPGVVSDMVSLILEGQWYEAADLHRSYHRLFSDMFLDTNPVPVKAAMAMMGLIEEVYRLPLVPMSGALREKLTATLEAADLL